MNEADLPSDLEDDDGDAEEDKTDVDGAEELQEQIETLRVQVSHSLSLSLCFFAENVADASITHRSSSTQTTMIRTNSLWTR